MSDDESDDEYPRMSAYEYGSNYISVPNLDTDTDTFGTDENNIVTSLYRICDEHFPKDENLEEEIHISQKQLRKATLENAWSLIRRWFKKNQNLEDRRKAASYQGQFSKTPLHLCCKCPGTPADIISVLIDCFPQTVRWPDSQGWLPLHYACAYGLSGTVLSLLCDSYPEGKLIQDKRMRTALHFTFFRKDQDGDTHNIEDNESGEESQIKNSMPHLVDLLGNSGACSIPDESGLLPMHYACAYGTSPAVLDVLYHYDTTSILASEKNGRTPIHYAMSNAQQAATPKVLNFLFKVGTNNILSKRDNDGNLPFHLLVSASKSCPSKGTSRIHVIECIKMLLGTTPKVDAEMFTIIQSLATWLRDHAVIHPHMQQVLNRKVAKPFHFFFRIHGSHHAYIFARWLRDNYNENYLMVRPT